MSTTTENTDLHLSHLDEEGKVQMVDVSHKSATSRSATARA